MFIPTWGDDRSNLTSILFIWGWNHQLDVFLHTKLQKCTNPFSDSQPQRCWKTRGKWGPCSHGLLWWRWLWSLAKKDVRRWPNVTNSTQKHGFEIQETVQKERPVIFLLHTPELLWIQNLHFLHNLRLQSRWDNYAQCKCMGLQEPPYCRLHFDTFWDIWVPCFQPTKSRFCMVTAWINVVFWFRVA